MSEKGVLLAVSSLPGKYGVGDFSTEAFKFVNVLVRHGVNLWQILPLNPVGYGHSPYQPFSSHAFDEVYISIEDLQKRGLVGKYAKVKEKARSNYEQARKIKENAIWKAYENFKKSPQNVAILKKFIAEHPYVGEYSEFISLKELNDNVTWSVWTVSKESRKDDFEYLYHKHAFAQMILLEQWNKIRKYANRHGIKIIGDVPFYVGYDSSDVYFHRESFLLDEHYNPTCVAGVPPDYFSKDGQNWGNPIWNWDYLYNSDFKAIMDRLAYASSIYDIVRLDHFRAFDSYWAINPNCETAIDGEWRYPDGYRFFNRLFEKYPNINLIVEDLGDLRPEVLTLKDHFNLPGIRELEFTIWDDEFNFKRVERENQVYYTSTHDNQTLLEWLHDLPKADKERLRQKVNELGLQGKNLTEKLIHYSFNRKERMIIIPAQDLMNLNKTHRMNMPGFVNDTNWTFKLKGFNKISRAIHKFF